MSTTVTAIFEDRESAAQAIHDVAQMGVPEQDMSVLLPDGSPGREFVFESKSRLTEGVAVGATSGAAIGAIGAGLSALAMVAVPGLGVIAAGPIVAALAGAGAGATAGGILGGLVGIGMPENEARLAADKVAAGSILFGACVHEDRVKDVCKVLEDHGATTSTT